MNSILFNQLTIFHAIADCGGITAAAQKLGMAAPSVSKSLKSLEQDIGTPLFYRTTRHISLTPEGQKLKDGTAQALNTLAAAVAECRPHGQAVSGTVSITVSKFAYRLILKDILGKFHRESGNIRLEISLNDGTVDIVEQGFDLGIRFEDALALGVIGRQILPPLKLGLYASRPYAETHGLPEHPDQLAHHDFIGYRFTTAGRLAPLVCERDGIRQTVTPRTVMVANDTDVVADAVLQGVGIGRIFEPLLQKRHDRADFVPVLRDYWPSYPPVSLYYHEHGKNRRAVKAVVDFIAAQFETESAAHRGFSDGIG